MTDKKLLGEAWIEATDNVPLLIVMGIIVIGLGFAALFGLFAWHDAARCENDKTWEISCGKAIVVLPTPKISIEDKTGECSAAFIKSSDKFKIAYCEDWAMKYWGDKEGAKWIAYFRSHLGEIADKMD